MHSRILSGSEKNIKEIVLEIRALEIYEQKLHNIS